MKPLSDITNTRQRRPRNTIYIEIMQLQIYQCILYRNLMVLIPSQIMFKMFTHIVENIVLYSIHHQTEIQLYLKILGQQLSKWIMSSQLSVRYFPMVCLFLFSRHIYFCCQDTYISIFMTHKIRTN